MPMNALLGHGCEEESWSPEVISLYGDAETIIGKLEDIKRDLPSRRVYIFTLEADKYSELAFYERTSPGKVKISRWKGRSGSNLRKKVHEAIMANKGVHCVGEQTKVSLSKLPKLSIESDVAAPANAKAAFSHQIRSMGTGYVNTSIYLMC